MTQVQSLLSSRTFALLGAIILPALAAQPAAAQQASFFDNFDTLSTQRWYVADGWANGAWQNCAWSSKQVSVTGGLLNVGFAPVPYGGRNYSCGELQTKQAFGYGTFEARLKTPAGSGLNAAFFTYIGAEQGKPHDEIDFEVLLKNTSQMQTTTFVNGKSGDGETGSGQDHQLPYPSDSDFTDYAVTWTADKIEFYVNKVLIRTMTDPVTIPTESAAYLLQPLGYRYAERLDGAVRSTCRADRHAGRLGRLYRPGRKLHLPRVGSVHHRTMTSHGPSGPFPLLIAIRADQSNKGVIQ